MTFKLLGETFQPLTLAQGLALDAWLKQDPQPLSGYTLGALGAWNPVYHYGWMRLAEGPLLISCHFGEENRRHLLMPLGPFPECAQEQFLKAAASMDYPLKIFGVTQEFLTRLPGLAQHFTVEADPAGANYIYSAQDLAELPGRKFHQKRNLIAQADGLYRHTVEAVTPENVHLCKQVLADMDREEATEITGTLANERMALGNTLEIYAALKMQGLLMRIDGNPVAFTLFEAIRPDMAVVHFEKARRSFKGIYQVLNQEAAKVLHAQGFALINREEDLGNEGLRRAKLSYNPVEVKPAHTLTFKR
jgi:hypothetical protein